MVPRECERWGWKHVSIIGEFFKGSGTKRWRCNHCNKRYNGSYSQVRAHLLGFSGAGIKSCPASADQKPLRDEFYVLDQAEGRLLRNKSKIKSRLNATTMISKEDVDDIVARFVYASGLSVSVVNSTYFRELVHVLSSFGHGYEPPLENEFFDGFLTKEKVRIEKWIALSQASWAHTGCTILCVNCLDSSLGCFCVNFFVASIRGIVFLKQVDMSEGDHGPDSQFLSVLTDVILEVGPTNVIQVITHLGSQASEDFESIILSKFPHIFWSRCALHSVKMLMEEEIITMVEWMEILVSCAQGIDQCMLDYQRSSPHGGSNIYKEPSDPISKKFAPSYCLVKRVFSAKEILCGIVASEEWKQWKVCPEAHTSFINIANEALDVEAVILRDEFWGKAELMMQLYDPFVRSISTFDIGKYVTGEVYDWRVQSLKALRNNVLVDEIVLNQLESIIENRWHKIFSPLHVAAYILNPKYFSRSQSEDKSLMQEWKITLEIYEADLQTRRLIGEQLSLYRRQEGSMGDEEAVESRDEMDPVAWWENFGFDAPQLQVLAVKVLSQVSSAVMCNESWKCDNLPCREGLVRLGLEVDRAKELVFVRNNLKLHKIRNGKQS